MNLWVDTDYGFDDLWALLLLRHYGIRPAGLSLVAGNVPLPQVIANAGGAAQAYGLDMPVHAGADRPLVRTPETAERILGPTGMPTRGRCLPEVAGFAPPDDGVSALGAWLRQGDDPKVVLALGPLTNIAELIAQHPQAARRITRLVWMGGSAGAGNHSPLAEFNALADPEALHRVAASGIAMDVVDLEMCRQIRFDPQDLPDCDPLSADLLGGYLDIALTRGRKDMAIYDPTAAMAVVRPEAFEFAPMAVEVSITADATYGATRFTPDPSSRLRLAMRARGNLAADCLAVFSKGADNGLS
ncbi:nucleoside hydrolase [Sagittula sp. SSi028]|uniref:nucleoside hydrolase n=1 Tax=Sagittula sp. SSi028 TaxID=3400636 RepID=UPI003AF84C74